MGVPQGYYAAEGMDVCDSGMADFGVSASLLKHLEQYGPRWKFHDAKLIPEALQDPTTVFEGLKRDGMEDAYCYASVPSQRWVRDRIEAPFPPNTVILVFASKRPWGFAVLDWERREADHDNPGCPKNWDRDFERRIWPTI